MTMLNETTEWTNEQCEENFCEIQEKLYLVKKMKFIYYKSVHLLQDGQIL